MKTILVTGFEPFGGEVINPSWEAVSRLPDRIVDHSVVKLCLPVIFQESANIVLQKAKDICPDIIVSVGQAGGRDCITPEYVAINLRNANIPDNNGSQPIDEPIILDGETAYFSTLPVRKIVEELKSNNISSNISYSAGTFVCNDVLYQLLNYYKGSNTKIGFIHIPYSTEQKKEPSMNLDMIIKGLTIAIKTAIEN